ncbi:MAG: aceF [Rhizobacter sp.]|nr:aceF [Rhizobacter sp.]
MPVTEVKVPDIGDFKDVEIIELLVKAGDTIKVDQSLVTVESDKASMEIPSTMAGVVTSVAVKIGDKINEGTVLLSVEAVGGGSAAAGSAPVGPGATPEKGPAPADAGAASSSPQSAADAAPAGDPAAVSAAPGAAPAPAAAPAPVAAAPAPAGGGSAEVVVPDIGDFDEVTVIEVLVKEGDTIKVEQSLITVESDKASMEIPSSQAGKLTSLKVKVGDKVAKGSVLAIIATAGGAAKAASAPAGGAAASAPAAAAPVAASTGPSAESTPAPAPSPAAGAPAAVAPASGAPATSTEKPSTAAVERTEPTAGLPVHEPSAPKSNLPHASPSVRVFARELGVPLDEVKGSGPKGRITQQDVQGFVKGVMSGSEQTAAQAGKAAPVAVAPAAAAGGGIPGLLPWPKVDFSKFGPFERRDLSRIKKIAGANLHRNWVMIPHVTNHDDADITELEAFRVLLNKEGEKSGEKTKVTMLAFLIKACVAALKKFPEFNSSLDGDTLVLKQYFHIGFAADTPNGLVVPVIRDADKKGVMQLALEMGDLAKKARDGKLAPADMTGGCFSISSLGGIGGTYFTPIINAPEVAILGVCRSAMKPVWNGKEFEPRLILPLSLSWDHRVVDGASAARFNTFLIQILGDFRRVLL